MASAALSVASSVYKARKEKKAAKKAARAEQEAGRISQEALQKAQDFQTSQFNWQKGQFSPYQQAGLGALGGVQELMSGGYDLTQDPIYQQRLQEQSKAFGFGGSGKGMQLSGAALKGLQNITGAELGAAYDRRMAGLGNLMNVGTWATGNLANIGSQYATNMSNLITGAGTAGAQTAQNLGQIGAARQMSGPNAMYSAFNTYEGLDKMGFDKKVGGMVDTVKGIFT